MRNRERKRKSAGVENCSPTFPQFDPKAEKEKDVISPPVGEAACCLKKLFPGKSALPPTPAGNLGIAARKRGTLLGLAAAESCSGSCLHSLHGSPFPSPPPARASSGSFLFLIQSLCKRCHNLSGAESDICLMEMLALL